MRYKKGDKIKINNLDWFYFNEKDGIVRCDNLMFTMSMTKYCDKILTVKEVIMSLDGQVEYIMEEPDIPLKFNRNMFTGLITEQQEEKIITVTDVCNLLCEMLYVSDWNDHPIVVSSYETIEEFLDDFRKRIEKE